MGGVINNLIEELQSEASGQLIDRGRIVDHLLDLRLAAAAKPTLLVMVDETLTTLPGKNVVEGEWWAETLDRFASAAQPEPVV